ncbi:MAG: hypothetical protein AAGI07_01515 [Bacteroidota bacterium]
MKFFFGITIVILLFPLFTFGQKGKPFPYLEGETLNDRKVVLPKETMGKYTLIGIAYSRRSDELLKGWYGPLYRTFVSPPEVAFIPQDDYDINMYFIALMKGIYKVADKKITQKMKTGIDKKFHNNLLMYQGKINSYKSELDLGEKDLPYFFVLDEKGKIVYQTKGVYTDKKMYEIQSAIETD